MPARIMFPAIAFSLSLASLGSVRAEAADPSGEWEVVGRPFTTAGGKNAHARVRKVSQPGLTDLPTWGAHKKITVRGPETK